MLVLGVQMMMYCSGLEVTAGPGKKTIGSVGARIVF